MNAHLNRPVPVVGAGLAGSEAALQIAEAGFSVRLHEMRPLVQTPAHQSSDAAELVCSNSLGSKLPDRAAGVLQAELRALGCWLLVDADAHSVPAGQALAVDRAEFAKAVTRRLEAHPLIELVREEVEKIPLDEVTVLASGPLTSEPLAEDLAILAGRENLSFFDAIAPVVVADSLDRSVIFAASRWGKGSADYLNIPLEKNHYQDFVAAVLEAETHDLKDFEAADPRAKQFFERCLPIEILAARGHETLRYGPMRPVGLDDPRTDRWPYAVIQMRKENTLGTLYNLVGFQTNLRYPEQERILRTLPGMQNAEFERLGSMHRNTFLDAPRLLTSCLEWRERQGLFLAGQITGMEGYLGNIGSGVIAGRNAVLRLQGLEPAALPATTLLGALTQHVAHSPSGNFQPMKAEFGLLPPLFPAVHKSQRKAAYAGRSADELATFLHNGRSGAVPPPSS
jgi:methylenetetrahydrofolate--tRNA-(uracil-5-)-methyltransferase